MKSLGGNGAYGARPEQVLHAGRLTRRAPVLIPIQTKAHKISRIYKFTSLVSLLAIAFIVFLTGSCENSMEKIKIITKNPAYPTLSRVNTEIFYGDSSRIKIRVWAAKLERYTQNKDPYINFPEGILVYFYDTAMNIESEITARSAIYYEKKQLWIARNDVVAKNNNKGELLNTEELYWDQVTHKIYSEKFSRIQTADGVTIGENGFEANQNFTWWRLKSARGTVNMKDEQ
jgi:LPS export ABC transporter protein LptC